MKLHLDFETRSTVDLTKVGAWHYALHPTTEVLCFTVGPTRDQLQTFGDFNFDWRDPRVPRFGAEEVVGGHNVPFEYAVYNLILHRRHGWPARWDPRLWTCTMARAAMVGLPLGLDELSRALEFKTPKDLEGRRVMHQLCRPVGADAMGRPIYDESPEKMARLKVYNRVDVLAEIEADEFLPSSPLHERAIWELDLVMNRRGISVDKPFAAKASSMSSVIMADINARMREKTNGAIDKATQITALKRWLYLNGVVVPTKFDQGEEKETLGKVALIELLADPAHPPLVRDVISLRAQASKSTSTAKYAKALEMVCPDGRIRGNLQYHGAHTGRWSGCLLQAHNFPKGFNPDELEKQATVISTLIEKDPASFIAQYGAKAMGALSDALRGLIVAGPEKELVSADFNAIEARVIFWLAGDESALATYRRGESPYLEMANYIFLRDNITKKGDPKEYDIGKRTILGAGFGMGWPKFKATVYEETAKSTGVPTLLEDELAERAIKAYREKHSPVVQLWKEVEAAAIAAVKNPGTAYQSCSGGRVLWGMTADRRFLVAKLPSGRYLWYYKPSVRLGKTPWGEMKEEMVYWGEHPKTGEWCQIKTYGGLLAENVTQAIARDLMAAAMLRCEAAGYEMILTVHDELLAEIAPDDCAVDWREFTLKDFMRIMCASPGWADGCPVAAEGWIGQRYRK